MRTIFVVLWLWVTGGLVAALLFGHLAHRAATRSPALERALVELTGLRPIRPSTKTVLAAAMACSTALLAVVGVTQTTEPPAPQSAPPLLGDDPRQSPPRGVPTTPSPATPTGALRAGSTSARIGFANAPAVTAALAGKRAGKLEAALRRSLHARAFAVGLRTSTLLARSGQVKHLKLNGRAVRIGHAKNKRR